MERFNRDIRNPTLQGLVVRDLRDARQAGVRGAPTLFVNGKSAKNWSLQGLQQMIEDELKRRG